MTSMLWQRSPAKRFWISSRTGKIKNPLKNQYIFRSKAPEHIPKYSHDVSNQSSEKLCFSAIIQFFRQIHAMNTSRVLFCKGKRTVFII